MSRRVSLLILLALALFALNAWLVYALFTSRASIAVWDFHPRWVGLRAMLRDGADPYSEEVTLAIQRQMLGRPARPDEDQEAFAYPLHVMVLIGPLTLLPLPVAQALWFSLLETGLLLFIFFAPRAVGWRPTPRLLALTALFTLGLYSTVWALILGQTSIVVAALIALAWWGLRVGRWGLAGACLALATIKPQMTFLLVPGLLAWAVYRRQLRLLVVFSVILGGLVLLPVPWLPTWPLAWLAAAGRYASYTAFDPPLVLLTCSTWLAGLVAALLLGWTVYRWWRAERRRDAFNWGLSMLLVVSGLIAPRTSHVNQLVLLLPLFFLFKRLSKGGIVAVVEAGLLAGPWLLDWGLAPLLGSLQHRVWQNQFISPILPVGLALALVCFSPWSARGMD
ncbi:MAG: glycosyltransferase 87 family protein [Anaerolineae bacterium]